MQTFDELPKELQEALSAEEGSRAEEQGLEEEWGELLHLYDVVDKHNHDIVEGNTRTYHEYISLLSEENIGDC